jgi:hypothetical protein
MISCSPDGKWVLWCDTTHGSGMWTLAATRLADGKTKHWKVSSNGLGLCWLSDSRHFVSISYVDAGISPYTGRPYAAPGIVIFDAASGTMEKKLVPGLSPNIFIAVADKTDKIIMAESNSFYSSNTPTVKLYRMDMHAKPLTVESLQVTVPQVPGSQDGTFYITPKGDGIVWHFTSYDQSLAQKLFKQHRMTTYDDFFVTNIDGTGLQTIGRLTDASCQRNVSVSPEGDKIAINMRDDAAVIPLPKFTYTPASGTTWMAPAPPQAAHAATPTPAQAKAMEREMASYRKKSALAAKAAGRSLPAQRVNATAVSGSTIYAGTDDGLSVSQNGGRSWSIPSDLAGVSVNHIAASGATAYAGSTDGLFATKDNGATWRRVALTMNGHVLSAADGPRANDVLKVACNGSTVCVLTMTKTGGFFVSTNGGTTWQCPKIGPGKYVSATGISISGTNIYVGTYNGLYVSRDSGKTFAEQPSIRLGNNGALNVYGVAATGSTVYAVVVESLYLSNDNGVTWTEKGGFMDYGEHLSASGLTVCLALSSYGASLSTDGGTTWKQYGGRNGLPCDYATDISISGPRIAVATSQGLSVTTDNGASWTTYR